MLAIDERRIGREQLTFSTRQFESGLPVDALGDPVGGATAYRLCVYDQDDGLVGRVTVDRAGESCGPKAKACWKPIKGGGYAYRDPDSSADGVRRLVARVGSAAKGSVKLKAANSTRKDRSSLPTGIAAALDGNARTTVQLVASDAGCTSVVLEHVKKTGSSIFKAKAR